MIDAKLIHPQILSALGSAGHGSTILIPDGNYPFETGANPLAERVYLNLAPGIVSVTDVLEALLSVTPVEAAHVMRRGMTARSRAFTPNSESCCRRTSNFRRWNALLSMTKRKRKTAAW